MDAKEPSMIDWGCRLIKGHNNKFYVHDIFIADEIFKNKGNTIKAGSAGSPVGESSKSIAYIKNILHNIMTVKQFIENQN